MPWDRIAGVAYARRGEVVVRCERPQDDLHLGSLGIPPLERLLRQPGGAAVAAAGIDAMVRDPRLRPVAPCAARSAARAADRPPSG
ncbi:hypothetical protein [Actinacidiphila acidipaludis]|uniref:Uncharacterized protein n=1 Tax=Actinacidiphila acidipaludis TaxID=2873382 RepID=A0ABS7PYS7_9ACTN|nr:hypothetical protein [Streptomyces acidipaludis]MBY8876042.1 hypothetical protein [Streptomyces acidipaludis]